MFFKVSEQIKRLDMIQLWSNTVICIRGYTLDLGNNPDIATVLEYNCNLPTSPVFPPWGTTAKL